MSRETEDQARKRRLEALRAMAAAPTSPPPPATSPGSLPTAAPTPSRSLGSSVPLTGRPSPFGRAVVGAQTGRGGRRLWPRVALALLALAVVAAGVLFWLRRSVPAPPIPDPLAINFNSATMSCPQTAAWSPDGAMVAVLGYVTCPGPNNGVVGSNGVVADFPNIGGTLLLYSAVTGHLNANITLDPTTDAVIPQSVRANPSALRNVGLNYDALIWSPDGKRLAIRYSATSTTFDPQSGNPTTTTYGQGLLLVTAASHAIKLLAQQGQPQPDYTASSYVPIAIERWDLQDSSATPITLPQALAYRWNPDGTLAPSLPLPATANDPAPQASQGAVGNPDGGKEFTVWQTGYVGFGEQCTAQSDPNVQQTCCPITSYLNAGFWTATAWSPDGRYLLVSYGTGIGANGKLAPPPNTPAGPPCSIPDLTSGEHLAHLPLRDAAMTNIVASLIPPPDYNSQGLSPVIGPSNAQFTWSPDGRRVIVTEQNYAQSPDAQPVFTIYDTVSGKATVAFTPPQLIALLHLPSNVISKGQSVSIGVMVWSPNSQRLLLLDPFDHAMVLLGPKTLKG